MQPVKNAAGLKPAIPSALPAAPANAAWRGLAGPALGVLVALMLVWWLAARHQAAERDRARAWAQGEATAIELGLQRAFSALDTLAALVRQSGGRLDFQSVGAELVANYPGLVSLEFQPGGVTSDIAPRSGNEKSLGLNALLDPGVLAAARGRTLCFLGPYALPKGGAGLIGRWPVYLRDAKGKESFWGLVSATVRLADVLAQANLTSLATSGYAYALLAVDPASSKSVKITGQGQVDVPDAVMEPVRIANLALRVRPRNGWGRGTIAWPGGLLVLLVATWAGLWWWARQQNDQRLAAAAGDAQRLARATERAAQAEERLRVMAAAGEEESRSANEAAEALRAQTQAADNQAQQSRERCAQMERELRLAKDTGATLLSSARKMAETLQANLRAAQIQLQQELETQETLRRELASTREHAEVDKADAQKVRAALQALLEEAQTELRRNREQLTRVAEGLQSTAVEARQVELAQAELKVKFEEQKTEAFREKIQPPPAEPSPEPAVTEAGAPSPVPEASKASLIPAEPEPNGVRHLPEPLPVTESVTESVAEPVVEPVAEPRPTPKLKPVVEVQPVAEPAFEVVPPTVAAEAPPKPRVEPAPPAPVDIPFSPDAPPKSVTRRRKPAASAQLSLFDLGGAPKPETKPEAKLAQAAPPVAIEKPKAAPWPPLNRVAFKKDATELSRLLAEADPGAQECLDDYAEELRPAFAPDAYEEFARMVRAAAFHDALALLSKTARKHGVNLRNE
jgi:hypothetical protein